MAHRWIDVHAHFTPPTTHEEYEARWKAMRHGLFMVSEPYKWSVENTLDYMSREGIQMQLLSNVPKTLDKLCASNDYGASLVSQYPSRFGLLAALPTDNPQAALEEIERADNDLHADGYAMICHYNGVYLSDPSLDPVWAELDRRRSVVFVHPDPHAPPSLGRPSPLLEVTFETTRTLVDMMYAGIFRKFPNMKLIVAHCGGALPALSGRLMALGTETWVPNPNHLTKDEMKQQLSSLYLDTAIAGRSSSLAPALTMTTCDHIVYGSDFGVPGVTEEMLAANRHELLAFNGLSLEQIQNIGTNGLNLFPLAALRIDKSDNK